MENAEKTTLLSRMYGRAGNRGIKLLLYLVFFALHFCISLSSYLPSIDPNEFTAAALANMFAGGDWTAAMSRSDYYYGFLQSVLYIPALLITKDPIVQYRIMTVINGAVMSFIPVIAYTLCFKLGVKKPWQAVFAAVCTGGWMTCLVHSRFIWNETAAVFIPFVMLYLLIMSDAAEKKSAKRTLSALLALVCGLAYCAHQRLIAAILAVAAAAVLSRALLKRRTLNLPVFFGSLAVFMTAAVFGNYLVQNILWGADDPSRLQNTAENIISRLPEMLKDGGVSRLFTALAAQSFYFICASWGLGALGISLFAVIVFRLFKSKKDKSLMIFGGERTVFLFYTAALTLFMLIVGAAYRFGAESFETSQSTLIFGRYMDGVIPLTVMLVFVFIFTEELDLAEILGGIVASGAVYLLFFFTGRQTALNAVSATISPMLGLYPVMFGENSGTLVTSTGFTAAVSCSMCLMTVFIVITSCAGRMKRLILSAVITLTVLYSASYGVFSYLPLSREESVSKNDEYVRLSSYVYNSAEAPPLTACGCGRGCVMMLQYLNQNIKVYSADAPQDIREDTYIIVPSDVQLRFDGQQRIVFVELAETENYKIYAYGERAKAYAQSQSGGEAEQTEEPHSSESGCDAPDVTASAEA
ncbi:MAG: hypothetical protein NC394_06915 [Bacteroides sp.]|nr:hypothetical protein [Bacteroides sp.]